jgi:hypothetical protein
MLVLALSAVTTVAAQSTFATHIGVNFFRYERSYLETGVIFLTPIAEQMELHLGADYGISTESRDDGTVDPYFLIPVNLGLNFTFPFTNGVYYLGTGVTPNFRIGPEADGGFQFYMGPYARTGLRYKVHEVMSIFLNVEQDLLIGGPTWINTSTRLMGGILFSFPPGES